MECKSASNGKPENTQNSKFKTGCKKLLHPGKSNQHKNLKRACENMYSNVARDKPFDVNFNEALKVIGTTGCKKAPEKKKFLLYPTILPKKELQRLKNDSKVISLEEKVIQQEQMIAENMRILEESERRKKLLQDIDENRMKARHAQEMEKPQNIDELDAGDRHKVLERAFLAKHEREEEVKKANRLILEAKCSIILDAQVAEKNVLAKEFKDEERRLEKIMLSETEKSFKVDDENIRKQEELRKKYADDIKRQLEDREFVRQMEAARIDEEAKALAITAELIERDEQCRIEKQRQKKAQLRDELTKLTKMNTFFKNMEFENERQAEMQIKEFMKAKEERENKIALEKKLAKEAMERLQEKMFYQQEKLLMTKSEEDDMIIRREQEKREREYRKKEKEAALKRKQLENDLLNFREKQLEDLKHRQALQIAQDEYEFKKVIESLKKAEAQEKDVERMRNLNKEQYREEIIRQMNMKEMERRERQRRANNEYLAWKEEEQNRDKTIRTIIRAKLDQMRDAKIPEKYIKDVEKQLKIGVK